MSAATALAVDNTAPSVDLRKSELRGAVSPTEVGHRRFCFLPLLALRSGRAPVSHVDLRTRVELRGAIGVVIVIGQPAAARRRDPRCGVSASIQPQIRVDKSVKAILPSSFSNSKRQIVYGIMMQVCC